MSGSDDIASVVAQWEDYHRRMSSITAEMVGAAQYLAKHPEYGTDERLAQTFREYAERMAAVEPPS